MEKYLTILPLENSMEKEKLTYEKTKEKALRLLEFRSHSEFELKQKLIRAGGTEIDKVLEFCREYNFLNDADYAKKCAKDLQHLKKYGVRRIKDELSARGIASELISEAISELETDEGDTLLPLMEKKLSGNFEKKNVDKAIRYFLYRGYGFSDINRCIDTLRNGE